MQKAQYGILRFAKYKGPEISNIEAHNERKKEKYASNPDIETILSAVVHMDEKTPHMHLSFVPITQDGRLCAKEILGNKKKLTWWQDEFWKHMVEKYPDLERGEAASMTGREHIPPRLFKEATSSSIRKKMDDARLRVDYENLQNQMNRIPPEILELAKRGQLTRSDRER